MASAPVAAGPGIGDISLDLVIDAVTDLSIVVLDEEGRVAIWNSGAQPVKGWREV